ncbi:uncharacterized protein LOC120359006 [Solenopsis invicta]|uniref:uncharacterized protein LOC120359006 n=1 Tax=Solenopsis invicta TaxID=13686 RepID=UPI00193EA62F|nr:uncharacterized protein LOC120359006 [Solenopsis invicta]
MEQYMERLYPLLRVTYPANAQLMVHNEEELIVPIRHILNLRVIGPQNIWPADVSVQGHINIEKKKDVQYLRSIDCDYNTYIWERDCVEDEWDLRILFGEKPYEEEEWWE